LTLISQLLCDRLGTGEKKFDWLLRVTATLLKVSDLSLEQVGNFLAPESMGDPELAELLKSMLRIDNDRVSLCDDSCWVITQCWRFAQMVDALKQIAAQHADALLPFPEWVELDGLHMDGCLRSRYLFALIFDMAYHHLTRPSLVVHYALNLFIICANQIPGEAPTERPLIIAADSMDVLALTIPENFHEFIHTPIYYNLEIPCTFIQLIEKLGPIGATVLIHSNIGWIRSPVPKPDLLALKQSIKEDFDKKRKRFEESIPGLFESPNDCSVCSSAEPDTPFCYPCVCFTSSIPSFIGLQRQGGSDEDFCPSRITFCCTHKVHLGCSDLDFDRCPVCYLPPNCFLPAFSADLREFDSPLVWNAARDVVDNKLSIWALPGQSVVDVLVDHVILLDGRASVRPEVLTLPEVLVLYRNLFLTVALAVSDHAPACYESGPLRRAIAACLTTLAVDRHMAFDFEGLGRFAGSSDLAVQRHLALFGHFMLGLPLEMEVIDWDAVLAPASLARLLRVPEAAPIELAVFTPIPLADDWFELLLPPYNFDIANMGEDTGVCLLTGQKIVLTATIERADHVTLIEQLHEVWKDGPMLLMHLTGLQATKILFTTLEFNSFVEAKPAWLDAMGTPDIGLDQGKLLSLNRTALAEIVDDLASGRFHVGLR
jgi:hypothetical protein